MSVECRIHCTGSFDGIRKHSSPIRVFAAIGNADPGAPPHEREAPAAAMREAAPRRGRGGDGRAPPERPRPPAPRPRRPIRRRMKSWTRAPGAVRRLSIWKRGRAVSRNRPSFAARRASGAPREGGSQSPDRSGVGPHGGRVGPRCGLGPSPDAGGGWSHRASVDEGEAVVRASGGGQALPRRRCRTGRRRRRARRSETTVARACGDTFRTRSTHAGDLPVEVCSAWRVEKFRRRYTARRPPFPRAFRLAFRFTARFPPAPPRLPDACPSGRSSGMPEGRQAAGPDAPAPPSAAPFDATSRRHLMRFMASVG